MKITAAALLSTLATTSAFAPAPLSPLSTRLASTIEKPETTSAPERIAPDAGWEPDWEGRTGLTPEEFMKSDMDKPDLSGMWECPLTRWDSNG